MEEIVTPISRIPDFVDVLLIADADTGYGNAANAYRTVLAYEKAGDATIQLDNQRWRAKHRNFGKESHCGGDDDRENKGGS